MRGTRRRLAQTVVHSARAVENLPRPPVHNVWGIKSKLSHFALSNTELSRVLIASMPAATRLYYILHAKRFKNARNLFLAVAVGHVIFDVF